MELKYSVTGLPYIELDDANRIIFSKATASEYGFKWLVFSGNKTTTTALSAGKGKKKERKIIKNTERLSVVMDMNFGGIPKTASGANIYLSKKYLDGIRRLFEPYLQEGIFPHKDLPSLARDMNHDDVMTPEDLMEDDPNGYYEDIDDDV